MVMVTKQEIHWKSFSRNIPKDSLTKQFVLDYLPLTNYIDQYANNLCITTSETIIQVQYYKLVFCGERVPFFFFFSFLKLNFSNAYM